MQAEAYGASHGGVAERRRFIPKLAYEANLNLNPSFGAVFFD